MSLEATKAAWAARGLTAAERLVLLDLADRASKAGIAYPSIDEIVERTGLGKTAVYGALRVLKAGGYINPDWFPCRRDVPVFVSETTKQSTEFPESGIRNPDSEQDFPPGGKNIPRGGIYNRYESPIESPIESSNGSSGSKSALVRPVGTLADSWKRLSSAATCLKPPRESLTPCGLPPAEERALAASFAEAQTMGYQPSDVEALADWINAGHIAMRSSPRQWICQNLCTALADAEAWRKAGSPPKDTRQAMKAPTQASERVSDYPAHRPMEQTAAQKRLRELERERAAAAASAPKP